jgi:hypothetical protein
MALLRFLLIAVLFLLRFASAVSRQHFFLSKK